MTSNYLVEMLPHEVVALENFLYITKPELSLEIGRYMGGSLAIIAKHSTMTYSIDPLPYTGYINKTKIIVGTSPQEVYGLPKEFDFVFIDGEHTFEAVTADIKACLALNPEYMIIHDSFMEEVAGAIDKYPWPSNYTTQKEWVQGIRKVPHHLGRCKIGEPAYGMALITRQEPKSL